jgi:hypothetical protein
VNYGALAKDLGMFIKNMGESHRHHHQTGLASYFASKNLPLDADIANKLLVCWSKRRIGKNLHNGMLLYLEMKKSKIKPTAETFELLFKMCAQKNDVETAQE